MRRPLLLGIVAGLVALCSFLVGFAAAAAAAPTTGFSVPGDATNTLTAMAPGADGSVWVEQKVDDSSYHLRRYTSSGDLAATSGNMNFEPEWAGLSSAPDGSALVISSSGSVNRVSADGQMDVLALPDGWSARSRPVSDANSNAWVVGCAFKDPGDFGFNMQCAAFKFSSTGDTTKYPLPTFDYWAGPHDMTNSMIEIFAVDGGVWIDRTQWNAIGRDGSSNVVFISDAGEVKTLDPTPNARLVAAGPGGKAWYFTWTVPDSDSSDPTRTYTFGQVTQDLNVIPASDPVSGPFMTTPPLIASNATGDLLFAFNHTNDNSWIGSFTGDSANVTSAPALESVIDSPNVCRDLDDGAIWTLAAPEVRQVGRLAADGTWSRFSPLTGHAADLTVSAMTQTTDGAIWFAESDSDSKLFISRADPTDPPSDETPAPVDPTSPTGDPGTGGNIGGTVTGKSVPAPAATEAELQAIAVIARKAARKWRGGHFSSKIKLPFPRAGRLDITIRSGSTVLAKVAKTRAAGSHKLKLKVGTAGRKLLKHHRKVSVTLTAKFSTSGRAQATSTLSFTL